MNSRIRITELWAWTMIDPEDDTEGIPAWLNEGTWMPMVGADRARIESLRPIAQEMARRSGAPIVLKHFSTMDSVDFVTP